MREFLREFFGGGLQEKKVLAGSPPRPWGVVGSIACDETRRIPEQKKTAQIPKLGENFSIKILTSFQKNLVLHRQFCQLVLAVPGAAEVLPGWATQQG